MKRGIEVRCSNGKIYKSISAAASAVGVNMWTFSQKMGVSGKFIDSEGNEYVRSVPARFKDKYKNTGSTMLKGYPKRRVVKEKIQELPFEKRSIDSGCVIVNNPLNFEINGSIDDFTMTIRGMSAKKLAEVIVLLTKEA